jgi:hypothetical protein
MNRYKNTATKKKAFTLAVNVSGCPKLAYSWQGKKDEEVHSGDR